MFIGEMRFSRTTRYGGLHHIGIRDAAQPQCCFDQFCALIDFRSHPERAILIFKPDDVAVQILPGVSAGMVQKHQGKQPQHR